MQSQQKETGVVATVEYRDGEGEQYLNTENMAMNSDKFLVKPNTTNTIVLSFDAFADTIVKKIQFNNILVGEEIRKAEIEIR